MTKTILSILTFTLLCMLPGQTNAQDIQQKPGTTEIEKDAKSISITVVNPNTIKIKNAEGFVAVVYDVAGKPVARLRIDSADKQYSLDYLEKGIYIVQIGKQTARKIVLK